MKHFFSMNPNDPHNIFFAARMSFFALLLVVLFFLSVLGTWFFLEWREAVRKHKRYVAEREEKRAEHVKQLMAEQACTDKLLYSSQSCTQTMPDMFGDARIVEEAFREFR
jgi:hypothetical protein